MGTGIESAAEERRIASERDFHNARFGSERDHREELGRWYAAVARGQRDLEARIRRYADDGVVLEYGCSDGAFTLGNLGLHRCAREVHGIDISDEAVAKAKRNAQSLSAHNAFFATMNAERMDYPDASFDLVFGRGISHHCGVHQRGDGARQERARGVPHL